MSQVGDRAVAGLLSALAEAPDFSAAASFLLTHLAELTGAPRAHMLRLDAQQESLALVSAIGTDGGLPIVNVSITSLSSPLVVCALATAPVRGTGPLTQYGFAPLATWAA